MKLQLGITRLREEQFGQLGLGLGLELRLSLKSKVI
jgi:hypothetical protein